MTYLGAKRIGSRATCALSSPTIAAAFIEGALAQGADVVDCGMMATDMLYYAVASDGLEGGAQITASHNPGAVQRHQDGPRRSAAAERRCRHRRDPGHDRRTARCRRPAGTPGTRTTRGRARRLHRAHHVVHRPVDRQAVQGGGRCRQRHGRSRRAEDVRAAAVPGDRDVLRARRPLPESRGQPAHRGEPRAHRGAGGGREGRHRHRLGRRRGSLLLHRRHRRVHLGRFHHGAPGGGVPAEAPERDGGVRPARELRGARHGAALRRHGR